MVVTGVPPTKLNAVAELTFKIELIEKDMMFININQFNQKQKEQTSHTNDKTTNTF